MLDKEDIKMRYEVEFNFIDGKCMNIKTGFKTEDEAKKWAEENTIDGKVSWIIPIKFK